MKNGYNLLFITIAVSLLFTIGFNIGKSPKENQTAFAITELKLEKSKGFLEIGETCFIDGKYEATVLFFSKEKLIFKTRGSEEDAGFLMCGAKYISKNQPLKIHSNSGYFEGRISKIIHDKAQ